MINKHDAGKTLNEFSQRKENIIFLKIFIFLSLSRSYILKKNYD